MREALVLQKKLVKIDVVDGDFTMMIMAAREQLDGKVYAFSRKQMLWRVSTVIAHVKR